MKAGRCGGDSFASVSPLENGEDGEKELEAGDLPAGLLEENLERLGPEKEDAFVRKLVDPKLPSQEEVDRHWLMGHVDFRNWSSVCLRCLCKPPGRWGLIAAG